MDCHLWTTFTFPRVDAGTTPRSRRHTPAAGAMKSIGPGPGKALVLDALDIIARAYSFSLARTGVHCGCPVIPWFTVVPLLTLKLCWTSFTTPTTPQGASSAFVTGKTNTKARLIMSQRTSDLILQPVKDLLCGFCWQYVDIVGLRRSAFCVLRMPLCHYSAAWFCFEPEVCYGTHSQYHVAWQGNLRDPSNSPARVAHAILGLALSSV